MLWRNKPHKHLTPVVQSNFFIQIQHKKYKEYGILFIGDDALENKKQELDGNPKNGVAFRVWLSQNHTLGLFF